MLFISAVTLAALALLWLGRDEDPAALDWPAMVPAFFVAVTAIVLFIHPTYASLGGPLRGAVLLLGKAGVWVLAPLGVCFLPAFVCLGVVPLVLGIAGNVLG